MTLIEPRIATIEYGSKTYAQAVALRNLVLREPLGLQFSAEELAAEHAFNHYGIFVGDELAGTVFFFARSDTRMQFRQMAVAPGLQAKGLGRRLLSRVEIEAAKMGFSEAFAEARIEALPFYLKLGYQACSELYMHVGVPHRQILKSLNAAAGD
jgi:GNAT superfamily N-acetyltransferase